MIRPATLHDIPVITLCVEKLRQTSFWQYVTPQLDYLYIAQWLQERLKTDAIFVAEEDDIVVGCIGAEITWNEFVPNVKVAREWAWWVEPLYRSKGYGRQLLKAVAQWGEQRGLEAVVVGRLLGIKNMNGPREYERHVWIPIKNLVRS